MHRNIILLLTASVYFSLASWGLYIFDVGLLGTSLVLFGLPAYLLARYSAISSPLFLVIVLFASSMAVLLESIAHIYGIWYVLGVEEIKLFGLVPLEVLVSSIVQIIFLVLLYEFIFDDGDYAITNLHQRLVSFCLFFGSALLLVVLHIYVLGGVYTQYSYLWIVGILVASSLAMLATHKALTLHFFDRLSIFTLYSFIPLGFGLLLSVTNIHKVFAYQEAYLYSFQFFGSSIPLEEILLVLALPLFVATVYEIYLDDGKV
jgi:hypothetical protein